MSLLAVVRHVAAFRACGSATFRNFARSAHSYEQGRAPLHSAINNLDERADIALRWHEHCSKSGRTAPQMHRVIVPRREEEESVMSMHGSVASAPGAQFLWWQDARLQSRALLRLVKATMAEAATLCLVQPISAQQHSDAFAVHYTGTLKKINESGEIHIGYRENSPPFAFLDAQRKPLGYSLDLCEIVVEEIVAELGKDIRVIRRPVTPENRFDLVTSGEIDLECGSTTNNLERRKSMAFSPTMFVTGTKLLVRRGSGILNFRDLAGKTVALTRGTVHETAIPKLAQRQNIPIKFVFGSDHGESFQLLATGKAEAFANDDVQLYGIVAEKKAAADFRVVGDFLTYADYALRTDTMPPFLATTPYRNTIPPGQEEKSSGNREIEHKIRSAIRWNAVAIILRANKESSELGGHIASFQSSALLYDIGFGHFWRGASDDHGGDLIYVQGHVSPGIYGRAYLEGRLTDEQLKNFRQESEGKGIPSYPHPWLMPEFWQVPTVSMGLGPLMAIYQARFLKYLEGRGLAKTEGRKVWAFLGDGEW